MSLVKGNTKLEDIIKFIQRKNIILTFMEDEFRDFLLRRLFCL